MQEISRNPISPIYHQIVNSSLTNHKNSKTKILSIHKNNDNLSVRAGVINQEVKDNLSKIANHQFVNNQIPREASLIKLNPNSQTSLSIPEINSEILLKKEDVSFSNNNLTFNEDKIGRFSSIQSENQFFDSDVPKQIYTVKPGVNIVETTNDRNLDFSNFKIIANKLDNQILLFVKNPTEAEMLSRSSIVDENDNHVLDENGNIPNFRIVIISEENLERFNQVLNHLIQQQINQQSTELSQVDNKDDHEKNNHQISRNRSIPMSDLDKRAVLNNKIQHSSLVSFEHFKFKPVSIVLLVLRWMQEARERKREYEKNQDAIQEEKTRNLKEDIKTEIQKKDDLKVKDTGTVISKEKEVAPNLTRASTRIRRNTI